jgi:hypothetical protein
VVVAVGGGVGQIHRRPPREQVTELGGRRLHRIGPTQNFFIRPQKKKTFFLSAENFLIRHKKKKSFAVLGFFFRGKKSTFCFVKF